jgi:hypothetical protein
MLPPKIWVETSLIYIATSLNSTYHPLTVTQEIAGSSPVAPATPRMEFKRFQTLPQRYPFREATAITSRPR